MEADNIKYMTREEIKGLDRSKIKSLQMTSGTTFILIHEKENPQIQIEEGYTNNNMQFRARKEVKEEENTEDKKEEKKEENAEEKKVEDNIGEKIEIEIGGQEEEKETEKKEVLRGPDGKPLLSEMLVSDGINYGQNNENINLYPVPHNYEPMIDPNMPGTNAETKKNEYQPPQPQPIPQP